MKKSRNNTQLYVIDGAAARNLRQEAWEEQEYQSQREYQEEYTHRKKRTHQHKTRLAPKTAAPDIDFFGMVVLVIAIGMTFFICVNYLQAQSDISTVQKQTASLLAQTDELATKNNHTALVIQESINLDEIQRVAIEELGMVYPYNNQMITYEVNKNGYVRQYGELTGNEQESIIELLMRMLISSKAR